ncbi:MAG: serine hydrolase [Pseudomonadota bacterium]
MLRLLARALAVLAIIAVAAGFIYRDRIAQLMAVNSLFAEDRIVENFSSMPSLFYSTELSRGDGPVSELPQGPELDLPEDYANWVEARSITSVVVLHDGEIVHEAYYKGTGPEDRRISWSVAKSYLATLVGTAVDAGEIASLDDPVTQYAPSLAGTAYDGNTVRSILQMSSGVVFDEDYLDFWSDINRMGRVLALGRSMDGFAEDLSETFIAPGEKWHYVSIDTHVLGMVLRGATGRSVVDLIQERLLGPLGLEQDGAYVTDGDGVAFVLGGLNFTTRDYARFGQMVLEGGEWQGERIVSEAWLTEATRASANTEPGSIRYGYQWWILGDEDISDPDHAFLGRGIYGQHLYIDPKRNVVIMQTAADRSFQAPGAFDETIAMLRQLAAATED